MGNCKIIPGHWAGCVPSMLKIQPEYELRFIRPDERRYVSVCWHASKAYGQSRSERLAYVVRQFVRKYPQYEGRTGGVYKDICGILENA